MYSQLANSDQQIPILVTSRFGTNPTTTTVTFAVVARGAAAPAPASVTLAASWYTDSTGLFWALCACGPTSPYVPTVNTTMDLYIKFTVGGNTVLLGPNTAQFT